MEFISILRKGQIFRGALFSIEGEVMNIVVKDQGVIKPGEKLHCQLEEATFFATVLKTEDYNLYLFVPHQDLPQLEDRRKYIRYKLDGKGIVREKNKHSNIFDVNIIDLSIHGVGFNCKSHLNKKEIFSISFWLKETPIDFQISIVNDGPQEDGYRYGCMISDISSENQFMLRRFILATQLQRL